MSDFLAETLDSVFNCLLIRGKNKKKNYFTNFVQNLACIHMDPAGPQSTFSSGVIIRLKSIKCTHLYHQLVFIIIIGMFQYMYT